MSIQGYCTLLGVLMNCYGYKFDEKNQPDRDELIMLALAELLMKGKARRGESIEANGYDDKGNPIKYGLR